MLRRQAEALEEPDRLRSPGVIHIRVKFDTGRQAVGEPPDELGGIGLAVEEEERASGGPLGPATPESYIWQARRTSSTVTRLQSGVMKDRAFGLAASPVAYIPHGPVAVRSAAFPQSPRRRTYRPTTAPATPWRSGDLGAPVCPARLYAGGPDPSPPRRFAVSRTNSRRFPARRESGQPSPMARPPTRRPPASMADGRLLQPCRDR